MKNEEREQKNQKPNTAENNKICRWANGKMQMQDACGKIGGENCRKE